MIDLAKLFDAYSRKARLYPALITLMPVGVAVLSLFPSLLQKELLGVLVGAAASIGLLFLLADIARTMGKRAEKHLLVEWDGWPTTRWLRHSDPNLPGPTKARYLEFLGRSVPGIRLPTAAAERRAAASADEVYRSAVDWLREQARQKGYGLVEIENANFGFRRNLYGLKPIGIALASAVAILAMALSLIKGSWAVGLPGSAAFQALIGAGWELKVSLFFACVSLAGWLFVVDKAWVKASTDAYARALLACCDTL